jgi:ribosome-binding factor A
VTHRLERVNITLQKELGPLISTRLSDPRLHGLVSVTKVEVSPDLANARVYVSVVGDSVDRGHALEALQAAAGHLSHEISQRIKIRRIPKLRFMLDSQLEQGAEINALIDRALQDDRKLRSRREPADR